MLVWKDRKEGQSPLSPLNVTDSGDRPALWRTRDWSLYISDAVVTLLKCSKTGYQVEMSDSSFGSAAGRPCELSPRFQAGVRSQVHHYASRQRRLNPMPQLRFNRRYATDRCVWVRNPPRP